EAQARDAALHFRDALFEHIGRGVHDPGIDVARHREVEQVGPVLRVVESVRGRLVDWHGRGFRRRFGCVAVVQCQGFKSHSEGFRVGRGMFGARRSPLAWPSIVIWSCYRQMNDMGPCTNWITLTLWA